MKFCWCTIYVNNMEESLRFYTEIIGLPINRRFPAGPDMEIAFLGDGETKVELICNANKKPATATEGISMGFQVKSVDEMINLVKQKGIKITAGPIQPNPHVRFFFVKDPNGFNIQFVENI